MSSMSHYLRIWSVAALALTTVCGCVTSAAPRSPTPLSKVVVVPFTVEPQSLPGEPHPLSQDAFVSLLALEAASSAGYASVQGRLAAAFEQAPSQSSARGQTVLTGTLRMPTALPPDLYGLRADSQKGPLARVVVRLIDPNGMTLRESEATLTWREARWLEGGPGYRRNRPTELVLIDVVHAVVERAVMQLRRTGAVGLLPVGTLAPGPGRLPARARGGELLSLSAPV